MVIERRFATFADANGHWHFRRIGLALAFGYRWDTKVRWVSFEGTFLFYTLVAMVGQRQRRIRRPRTPLRVTFQEGGEWTDRGLDV